MIGGWRVVPSTELIDSIEAYCINNNLKPDSRQIILILTVGLEKLTGEHIEQPLRQRGGNRRKSLKEGQD